MLLSQREVEELLDIDALAGAMVDLSVGRASVPNRVTARVGERDGLLAAMPGYTPSAGALASKLVTLFPHNAGTEVPAHQGVIAVFDPDNGTPIAGRWHVDHRYPDGSRLGARHSPARARGGRDAHDLGTGVQARSHARAVTRVRDFGPLRVAGRDRDKAGVLSEQLTAELDLPVRATTSWQEACDGADVICATTQSLEPVVRREWLAPGTHVTSVGYNPNGREVDDDPTVVDSLGVVESRDAALAAVPAGSNDPRLNDLLEPIERGLIDAGDVAEVGELVDGGKPGRSSPEQITLYKSVGVVVQDGVAAALVLRAARERGAGQKFDL